MLSYGLQATTNPTGVLYNPLSIVQSLNGDLPIELVEHDGLYHSMAHHSSFSGTDIYTVVSPKCPYDIFAKRGGCSLLRALVCGGHSHTCRLSGVFSEVHAPRKNIFLLFFALRGEKSKGLRPL